MSSPSFFLSLLLISSTNHVKSNEEGYISVDISNKGLDFAKDFLVQMVESSLVPLDPPKIEKSKHIPFIGTVHMGLPNITVDKIHVISSTVKVGDTDNGEVSIQFIKKAPRLAAFSSDCVAFGSAATPQL
ncbi:putative bpilbp family protein [Nicotiana attenuata]|uniref:Bpilbp family protein n=1 Tax=Nicotiana attenuata TaxID=49451 RepID=A0A1J6IF50_NICAT|nr:putative bpilbp family protein [Nicotiana attenuata]